MSERQSIVTLLVKGGQLHIQCQGSLSLAEMVYACEVLKGMLLRKAQEAGIIGRLGAEIPFEPKKVV